MMKVKLLISSALLSIAVISPMASANAADLFQPCDGSAILLKNTSNHVINYSVQVNQGVIESGATAGWNYKLQPGSNEKIIYVGQDDNKKNASGIITAKIDGTNAESQLNYLFERGDFTNSCTPHASVIHQFSDTVRADIQAFDDGDGPVPDESIQVNFS